MPLSGPGISEARDPVVVSRATGEVNVSGIVSLTVTLIVFILFHGTGILPWWEIRCST
jgi:hypothetical protein